MGATVMDHVEIGENSIIAAGALVLKDTKIESNSIYAGVPAKYVKSVDPEQTKDMINRIADNYLIYAGWYREDS
jgi:carbonic anhydrase/acetyltransferase-like protein (isoleucine patch superfamily)